MPRQRRLPLAVRVPADRRLSLVARRRSAARKSGTGLAHGYRTEAEQLAGVHNIATEWYVEPQRRAEFMHLLARDGFVKGFVSEVWRHKTRERIWISENAHAVPGARGAVLDYEGTVEEITERVAAENALRASEERWKLALDSSGDGVGTWICNWARVLLAAFLRAPRLQRRGDRRGCPGLRPARAPRRRGAVQAARQAHLDGRAPRYISEHRVRCKHGSWRWVLSRGLVIGRDDSGRPLRIIGTHTDITAIKRPRRCARSATAPRRPTAPRPSCCHASAMSCARRSTPCSASPQLLRPGRHTR